MERKARHNNSVAKHPGKRIQVVLYNKLPFTHFHFIFHLVFWLGFFLFLAIQLLNFG